MTDLQVIGAGLGRTGTLALREALEQLNFGPCYHMFVAVEQPEVSRLWKHVRNGQDVDINLKKIFAGFRATVSVPGCLFFEKFLEWNPDAKVVLSVRDTPQQWVESVSKTLFVANPVKGATGGVLGLARSLMDFLLQFTVVHHIPHIGALVERELGANPWNAQTDLIKVYQDWIVKVRAAVPADKLLIYNVKEGWVPLCDFLQVPIPDAPFPKSNGREDFKEFSKRYGPANRLAPVLRVVAAGICLLVAMAWYFLF